MLTRLFVSATLAVFLATSGALAAPAKRSPGLYATMKTNMGTVVLKLYEKEAPKTVANFVGLAKGTKAWTDPRTGKQVKKPFYNGLTFHRVISGFMIQGGDPLGNGSGGPGYEFANETHPSLRHDRPGRLAMANAGPDTNGSQFYITVAPKPHLDGGYSIFGQVVEGMPVVMKISEVPTNSGDMPLKPVVIQSVTIQRVGAAAAKSTGSKSVKKP